MIHLEAKDALFRGETSVALEFDTKAMTEQGEFEGYGSTFGNMDLGGDICTSGCFGESLNKRPAQRVKMLMYHDTRRPCGVWKEIAEDGTGLRVKGQLLLTIKDGKEAYELMRAGALDAMSIGYRTLTDEIDRTSGVRKILKADLMEVSIVTFPMNEKARIGAVKGSPADFTPEDWRDIEATLITNRGMSQTAAKAAVAGFKDWLQREAGVPSTDQREADSAAGREAIAAVNRLTELFRSA